MAKKLRPAKDVLQDRGEGAFWLDHAVLTDADLPLLKSARRLTLWNVVVPDGFLARLPRLWWVDLRGGTGTDLGVVRGCAKLRYLQVNQVRGTSSLALLPTFPSLSLLSLYGLPQVKTLPSLAKLTKLRRIELGMMAGLTSLTSALTAPALKELFLTKKVVVGPRDVRGILAHPKLRTFGWSTEDVPVKVFQPVLDAITLEEADAMHPEEWFGLD
jgi:hypothetical protein